MRKTILEGEKLVKQFGALVAVNQVNIRLYQGEMLGLIGSNGAGKTTLFDLLCGCQTPDTGKILVDGVPLRGSQELFVRHGVTRTFQNLRLFSGLTVQEHLLVPMTARKSLVGQQRNDATSMPANLWHKNTVVLEPAALLEGTPLVGKEHQLASSLPYGQMRMLELLRGVATGCRILLLDEPGAGLSREEKVRLVTFLQSLAAGYPITFLIIEHDLDFIRALCGRVYAMHLGKMLCHGTPAEVLANKEVQNAFLGR